MKSRFVALAGAVVVACCCCCCLWQACELYAADFDAEEAARRNKQINEPTGGELFADAGSLAKFLAQATPVDMMQVKIYQLIVNADTGARLALYGSFNGRSRRR